MSSEKRDFFKLEIPLPAKARDLMVAPALRSVRRTVDRAFLESGVGPSRMRFRLATKTGCYRPPKSNADKAVFQTRRDLSEPPLPGRKHSE